jgi:hypothetical protein
MLLNSGRRSKIGCALFFFLSLCAADMPGAEAASRKARGASECGWAGIRVSPMTKSVAASLGFVSPYGAIFETPKPNGPAAAAGIEAGDVVTTINGAPLSKSGDFEGIIAQFAPGSVIYLTTLRDGELFDRTITLGYARCPSRLSASNLAASQAADAFPSLKKPTKLFDAGQLTPGAPLLLSSIRHLINQSVRLKNEVNSALLSAGKLDDEINCTGMEFSGQWNNLAGTRVPPYTCDLGTKQLSIDATVTIKGPNGTVYDLVTPAAIENADAATETRPVWRWLPKDN